MWNEEPSWRIIDVQFLAKKFQFFEPFGKLGKWDGETMGKIGSNEIAQFYVVLK